MYLFVYVELTFNIFIVLATDSPWYEYKYDFFVTDSSNLAMGSPNSTKSNFNTTCHSGFLQKCCKPDEIYKVIGGVCTPDVNQLQNSDWTCFPEFEILLIHTCPYLPIWLNNSLETEFQVFSNASVYALGELTSFREYCMDFLIEDEKIAPFLYIRNSTCTIPFLVTLTTFIEFKLSIFFLIITTALYLATPKLRKNIHDKCCLFHSFSLTMGFSFLTIEKNIDVGHYACAFVGYMIQFWMLASFFWLNIMSFDMWRSIDNMGTLKKSNVQKLRIYCLYAWGCPCLIFIICLLLDNYLPSNNQWRPGVAETRCLFKTDIGEDNWVDPAFVYFFGVIWITLLLNIYTFVDTAITIRNWNKRWKQDENADSRKHNGKNIRFTLYLKLFVVMGLYWVMEVISYHYVDGLNTNTFWLTINFISHLPGIFIFIIYICNKRVLTILKERFFTRN